MRCFHRFLIVFVLPFSFLQAQDTGQLQRFVDEAIKAGKGTVSIPPGTYVLPRGVLIKDAKQLRIIGMDREKTILKLPPLAFAECARDTPAGSTELPVVRLQNITAGIRLWIEADGAVNSFTEKPTPYLLAVVKAVEKDKLLLTEPLKFPVPAKTVIRDSEAPNLMEIRGTSEEVLIRNLTLDGGRTAADPVVRAHAQLCGVFASGIYSYEKGPTGPKVRGVAVEDCIIQNFFGRGVAFYSVERCRVERCTIMETNDEAVDFDHFSVKCEARGNHIARCRVAFELNDANDCILVGNEIRDCDIGVNLWRWCKQEGLNEGNLILNNSFTNIAGNAVQLGKGTRSNTVSKNDITGCGRNGIVVDGEQQRVEDNRISEVKLKPVAE